MSSLVETECADPEPIFIVGIPRSGTTLVKACLNKHSRVHILGETRFFLGPYSYRSLTSRSSTWRADTIDRKSVV